MRSKVCTYDEEGINFDDDSKSFFVFASEDNEENKTIEEFDL